MKTYQAGLVCQAPMNASANWGFIKLEHQYDKSYKILLCKFELWFYLFNVFKLQKSSAFYFFFNRDIFWAFFSNFWKDGFWVACFYPENQFLVPLISNQFSDVLLHFSAEANVAAFTTQYSENLNNIMQYKQENLLFDDIMQYEQENLPLDDIMQYK